MSSLIALPTKFTTDRGTLVMVEPCHELPLVDVSITLRTGSTHDPVGREGLMRLSGRMLRMGTRSMTSTEVDEAIDRMGAQLSVECSPSSLRFSGAVLARNLDAFFELLSNLWSKPALRASDLALLKRETLADLDELLDNDRMLAARHFRRHCLPDHLYGRSVVGTRQSLRRISRAHIEAQLSRHLVASNVIVGIAGPVSAEQVRGLVERHLGKLSKKTAPVHKVPEPIFPKGRRLLLVDKPERAQAQILIGTLGASAKDRDLLPLMVGNTVFGGTFSSRLTNEVRSKRGWSYGASSSLGYDRGRDLWSMWTFPAVKDAIDCAALQLQLLERFVDDGVSAKELKFAQRFLTKSHAFDIDTAHKRLEHVIEAELMGLPLDFHVRMPERVHAVTLDDVNAAVRRRLKVRDLSMVIVATASDVQARVTELPSVREVSVVPFDSL